jgi:hypothetical protein
VTTKTVACVELSCNVCGEHLDPNDDGVITHFTSLDEAVSTVVQSGWIAHRDGFAICDAEDPEHDAAIAELMPPEFDPVCDGQTEIPFTENGANA